MTDKSDGPRRPLLAFGERLTQPTERSPKRPDEKYHPVSLQQAQEILQPQAHRMLGELRQLHESLRAPHVVFEGTLWPNYLASSWSPSQLLNANGLYVVGSKKGRATRRTAKKVVEAAPTRTLLIAGAPQNVAAFANQAFRPVAKDTFWDQLRRFAQIELPTTAGVIKPPPSAVMDMITWEAVLSQVGDTEFNRRRWSDEGMRKFAALVADLGGSVELSYRRDVGELSFVPVRLDVERAEEAGRFNLLRALRPMPKVRRPATAVRRSFGPKLSPPESASTGEVPELEIGVFDGGVDVEGPFFRNYVECVDVTTAPPTKDDVDHGTLVTSAALYGPLAAGQTTVGEPVARVKHYRVLPPPPEVSDPALDLSEYWLLDQIVAAVRRDNLKIVSLSVAPEICVEDDGEPTRWTAEIDSLIHELSLTVFVAAGNNGAEDAKLGFNRIQVPADGVNVVGVGACARHDGPLSRASYSAYGPGRDGARIQPLGVYFGGADDLPFLGVDATGRLLRDLGTSYAAPAACRGTADLQRNLDPRRRTPELARAFAAHFAQRNKRAHKAVELGYGRLPQDYAAFWDCKEHEVTVLYQQQLVRGEPTAMRFPLPAGLRDAKLELEWTISYVTDVEPKDSVEYTRCGLECTFRPDLRQRSFTPPKGSGFEAVKLDVQAEEGRATGLLAAGFTIGANPIAHNGWRQHRGEQQLRSDGKWETLSRGRVLLPASALFDPRLDVVYLRRQNGVLLKPEECEPLEVTLVLTVRAPEGVGLYDLVAREYPALEPLVQIPILVRGVA